MEEIQYNLHNRFPSLPHNALKNIYKARVERLCLLNIHRIPADIHSLIEAQVRLASEFSNPFISYMPNFGKKKFARKRKAKQLGSNCHKCARLSCEAYCKTLKIV